MSAYYEEKIVTKDTVTMFRRAWLWSKEEERLYAKLCVGRVLHLFSGYSLLGEVRVDIDSPHATHKIDLSEGKLPFKDLEFDTIIADPPWTGPQTWDRWTNLMREIVRVVAHMLNKEAEKGVELTPKLVKEFIRRYGPFTIVKKEAGIEEISQPETFSFLLTSRPAASLGFQIFASTL